MESKERQGSNKNLAIIFGTTLMAVLGVSSITPAFPAIMEDLNLSETEVGMLITVFTLPGVFLTPVLGFAADRLDRKRVLTPSLLLFGIAGGICFFITDFTVLLILRFFQGIGASALGAISTILIGDIYSGTQRARIMGLNASVLSIGTAFYPLIGGALAMISWSHPFLLPWIAIPIGLYAINGAMLRAGQTLGPPVIGLAFAFKGYEGAFTTGAVMALIGMLVGTFVIKKSCAN